MGCTIGARKSKIHRYAQYKKGKKLLKINDTKQCKTMVLVLVQNHRPYEREQIISVHKNNIVDCAQAGKMKPRST